MKRETKLDIIELGRGYLGVLIMSILMGTGVVSAMYAGDSMTFPTNFTNPVYTIIGNSSNMEGLIVEFENGNITISTPINYKPDNFTLIFFDNLTKEIIKIVPKNVYIGGGGSTRYVDKNVTVYVPEYIDKIINNTEEIEVEKVVEKIVYQDTGYELWMVFLAMATGAVVVWIMMWRKGDGNKKTD